jgi:NTE family protein
MKLGLALGNGAAKGYSHIPIIKHLEKEKIKLDAVSGSSIGALIGAYYCLHGNLDGFVKSLKHLSKVEFLNLIDLANPKHSVIKGKKIYSFFHKNYFGNKTFKDLKKKLFIASTNFFKEETVYFDKGKIIDAVMASVSIPGVFPPYRIKNQYFIDGGMLDPIPSEILFENGCEKVIGINLNKQTKYKEAKRNALNVLMATYGMMLSRISEDCKASNIFMLEPTFTLGFGDSLKFYHWRENYSPGVREIHQRMEELRKWLHTDVDPKFW